MKHLKMLGLAMLAAMGVMAFVGVGTASATTFFTDEAHTNAYPQGTTFHESLKSGTSAALKTTGGTVIATCTESTLHGKLSQESGTWLEGSIESLTWGGCNQTTDTVNNGTIKDMWTSGTSGEVVGVGSSVTLSVFGTTCTYGTGEGTTLGTLNSGTAPEVSINANISKVAGNFLCPSSGVWTATYIVTAPHALYQTS